MRVFPHFQFHSKLNNIWFQITNISKLLIIWNQNEIENFEAEPTRTKSKGILIILNDIEN